MFEFGALPPEITSAWMYTGPGSAPMMATAAAWRALAAELGSTGAAYHAVIAEMTGSQWTGPSATAMVAAATPYLAWMNVTAAQAEQAADQATAAAGAFEAAHATVTPPPVILANRTLLMTLVATNFLGQNTPAIMATEAHYLEMWAQNAAAMYGYAASSAVAAQVTPFTQPKQVANRAGLGGQAAAVAQAGANAAGGNSQITQLLTALPNALQSLAAPLQGGSSSTTTSGLSGILSGLLGSDGISGNVNGIVNSGAWNISSTLSTALGFLSNLGSSAGKAMGSAASGGLISSSGAAGSAGSATALASAPAGLGGMTGLGGSPVLASAGRAGSIGSLSVPASWASSNPVGTGSAVLQSATTGVTAEGGASAVPAGMPFGGLAGRADGGSAAPKYGFRPLVVMHPVAAG